MGQTKSKVRRGKSARTIRIQNENIQFEDIRLDNKNDLNASVFRRKQKKNKKQF